MGKKALGALIGLISLTTSVLASEVIHTSGVVELYGSGGKVHPPRGPIQSRLRVVTQKGWVKLKLRPQMNLWIFENTELEYQNSQLTLSSGRLYVSCKDSCDVNLSTPVTSDLLSPGEYLIEYFPKVAKFTVAVKNGSFRLRGLGNDKSLLISENQAAEFEGRFEFGEIAYDILLQGKKSARGLLSAVREPSPEERRKMILPVIPKVQKSSAPVKISDFICSNPRGKLNQCLWRCVGASKAEKTCLVSRHSCERSRCNANGKWSDQTLLEPTRWKCKSTSSLVAECDY